MITKIDVCVQFWGQKFSPASAEQRTGLTFDEKNEVGDLGRTGRHKGEPIPFGAARLEPPPEIPDEDKILWLAASLKGKMEAMEECGLEEAHFYAGYFYEEQCNCTLTASETKAIAEVGIPFWFSCYDMTEIQEPHNK
jgi:hypothetical protein